MIETIYGKELRHHGIEGMKWGKRNGPPYPLNPSTDYSSTEKKKNGISKNSSTSNTSVSRTQKKNAKYLQKAKMDNSPEDIRKIQKKLKISDEQIKNYHETEKAFYNADTELSNFMLSTTNGQFEGLIKHYFSSELEGMVKSKDLSKYKKLKKNYDLALENRNNGIKDISKEILGGLSEEPVKNFKSMDLEEKLRHYMFQLDRENNRR